MERIETSVEIAVPLRTAYNQWTQFEDFPRFVRELTEVRQVDATHLEWHAAQGRWSAEITEQVPDERIAWRGTSGAPSAGEVRFEPLAADRTRVSLALDYEPDLGSPEVRDLARRVEHAAEAFKSFLEKRGQETGGWRGEIHGAAEEGPASLPNMDPQGPWGKPGR